MLKDDVDRFFDAHGDALSLGAIDADELLWMQDLVATHGVKRIIEVGTATGMSTGLLAKVLEDHGGLSITSVDYDHTFYGDPTKPNGFLVPSIYPEGPVEVDLQLGHIAVDSAEFGQTYEMSFIDANHQHPYPMLDLLAVFPVLTGPKIAVFHDLRLYKDQDVPFGLGPKIVHDQFPPRLRSVAQARRGNIFALDLSEMTTGRLERLAMDGLLMPWTMRTRMTGWIRTRTRDHMAQHYSPRLLKTFDEALRKFNHPFSIGDDPA